ncbi:MAG: hypothetical protein MUE44_26900 [Oscillatoriaceae cyanobacterium Prado104]|jgi:hypothetical protein|nr:hypothetical protein [Oscillatoriaceae cyanobacterium Prado104]
MTDDDQKNLRRASAQAFFESLDQLFESIESNTSQPPQAKSPPPQPQSPTPQTQPSTGPQKPKPAKINLSDFEDAIADLEQFIKTNKPKRPDSNQ